MVSNGLVVPFTAAVLLVYWPVINGISWVTLTSASSLFIVMSDGVEIMLLVPSLRNACTMAAKFVPEFALYRPMASVAPVGMALDRAEAAVEPVVLVVVALVLELRPVTPPIAAAAKLTMLVPLPGRLVMAAGTTELP